MRMSEFLEKREQERAWAYANGFGNGNPETNGEYLCVDFFLNSNLSLFLDVGANRGIFSRRVLEKKPNLALLAFEPNPQIRHELETSIANGSQAKCYSLALDEFEGREVSFHVHPTHHETSSLSKRSLMTSRFQADMQEIKVPVRTLDSVLQDLDVDLRSIFLKIDTEGHEAGVLRGARSTLLTANKVAVLFEYSFAWIESGQSIEDIFQFLDQLGFDFYRVLPTGLEHLRFLTRHMKEIQYCNYVALKNQDMSDLPQVSAATPLGANTLIHLA
jgi:FkbM family methyltransferase